MVVLNIYVLVAPFAPATQNCSYVVHTRVVQLVIQELKGENLGRILNP